MVRPWMLSETKVCERTQTATKKRGITQNAVETALPAYNALKNSKTSSFGPEKSNIATRAKSTQQRERTNTTEKKCSRKTHVVDQNLETATTKTDPKKASGRQVSRLAKTTTRASVQYGVRFCLALMYEFVCATIDFALLLDPGHASFEPG